MSPPHGCQNHRYWTTIEVIKVGHFVTGGGVGAAGAGLATGGGAGDPAPRAGGAVATEVGAVTRSGLGVG